MKNIVFEVTARMKDQNDNYVWYFVTEEINGWAMWKKTYERYSDDSVNSYMKTDFILFETDRNICICECYETAFRYTEEE